MDVSIKQSKVFTTFMLVLYIVIYGTGLGVVGFLIKDMVDFYNENQALNKSLLCETIVLFVSLVAALVGSILSVVKTMRETYTFTSDRMVKAYKQTVKLEIPFSVIETVRISGMELEIYYKRETKKGVRLQKMNGWFSKSDIQQVKEKITDYNNENNASINIQVLQLWG